MGTRDFRSTQSSGDWSHLDSNHSSSVNSDSVYTKTVRLSSCLVVLGVDVSPVLEQFFYCGRLARVGSCVQRRVASIVSDIWWCVAVLKKKPDQSEPYKPCFSLEDRCGSGRLLVCYFVFLGFGSKAPTKTSHRKLCYIQRCRVHPDVTAQPLCRILCVSFQVQACKMYGKQVTERQSLLAPVCILSHGSICQRGNLINL